MHRLAVTLCALVIAVAACGGDSDADPGPEVDTDESATSTDAAPAGDEEDAAVDVDSDAVSSVPDEEVVDSTDESGESTASDQELCTALSVIVDLNDDMGLAMQPLESMLLTEGVDAPIADEAEAIAAELESGRRDIENAYADAVAAASGDLRSNLEVLAENTPLLIDPMVEVFRETERAADLAAIETIFEDEELRQAALDGAQAALAVDEFAIPTCGFRFSNT